MTNAQIKDFIFAGHAIFTLQSGVSGKHYTYKVTRTASGTINGAPAFYVSVLTAPEDYTYIGMIINGKLMVTKASREGTSNYPSFAGLAWFLGKLNGAELPSVVTFRHEGRCGACGRPLTTPESIDSGFGPVCAARM